MQETDYFEDFGETHVEEEDVEKITSKKTKGNKNKNQGKDKLMGELEHLALGEENEVRSVTHSPSLSHYLLRYSCCRFIFFF